MNLPSTTVNLEIALIDGGYILVWRIERMAGTAHHLDDFGKQIFRSKDEMLAKVGDVAGHAIKSA